MTADVLVIGGALAGNAAAILLARGGAQVTLVERERTTGHKVCGEFLSAEALIYLRQLGIDVRALGAVPLHTVRFTHGKRAVEQDLPFPAMSLTRRCLDEELLHIAERAGVRVKRGCAVEHLARTDDVWQAALAGGERLSAHNVFLASGKSDLRGHGRPQRINNRMVAFKMYWRLNSAESLTLGSAVELITYPGGYAGLQPVEDGLANLCCLIHVDQLRRCQGQWEQVLAHMCRSSPHLQRRLDGAESQLPKPLTIASIPYGFVRKNSSGIWYLGDQAVVIPSFTGDGMSLALHTGALAAQMYLQHASAQQYQQALAAQVRWQVALAGAAAGAITRTPALAMMVPRVWTGAMGLLARKTRIPPAFRVHPPAGRSQTTEW